MVKLILPMTTLIWVVMHLPVLAEQSQIDLIGRYNTYSPDYQKPCDMAYYFLSRADYYQKANLPDSAESPLQAAIILAEQNNLNKEKLIAYHMIALNYQKQGKVQEALLFLGKYDQIRESYYATDKDIAIVNLSRKIEQQQKELNLFNLYKEQMDLMYAEREALSRWLLLSGILLVMAIISGLALYFFRVRYFRKKLEIADEKLKQQNKAFKSIMDDEEKERINIAHELYNGLGKVLTQAKMQIFLLEDMVQRDVKPVLSDTIDLIDIAESKSVNLSRYLIPGELVKSGLIPAINELIENLVSQKSLKVTFKYYDYAIQPPMETEVALYRIVEEILNNAVKHHDISHIIIVLKSNGTTISLDVVDDGNGMTLSEYEQENGVGWLSLNTRVHMLNGELFIKRGASQGTSIKVELIS